MWVRGLKPCGVTDSLGNGTSHPVWVRGLKLEFLKIKYALQVVAPRVGAWIETNLQNIQTCGNVSHPVWVRGLKLSAFRTISQNGMSHPVWVRGLKLKTGVTGKRVMIKSHPVWVRGLKLIHALL